MANGSWHRGAGNLTKAEALSRVRGTKKYQRSEGRPIPKMKIRKDPNGRYEVWVKE